MPRVQSVQNSDRDVAGVVLTRQMQILLCLQGYKITILERLETCDFISHG